jgi:DNA-binding NarL/FixJ family response regulator
MLLAGTGGYEIAGSFSSVEEALGRSAAASNTAATPHVVLLDIQLPGVAGSQGVARLLDRWPQAVVLMLTGMEDDDAVFESLANGAVGYLLKRTPPVRLLEVIREARDGGSPMSPEIARKLVAHVQRGGPPARVDAQLSERERRLLALLADGFSYQDAGEALGVTINTVRQHIRSIYEKLQVHDKAEAVSKALRGGLLTR